MLKRITLPLMLLALMSAGALGGCVSSTERARRQAVESAEAFHRSVAALPDRIQATADSLVALTSAPAADTSKGFREFSKRLTSLESAADDVGARAERAATDALVYVRKHAEDKISGDSMMGRMAIGGILSRTRITDAALSGLDDFRAGFSDLAGSLRAVRDELKANLSPDAINSLSPWIQKVVEQARVLKDYASLLDEQIAAALGLTR